MIFKFKKLKRIYNPMSISAEEKLKQSDDDDNGEKKVY